MKSIDERLADQAQNDKVLIHLGHQTLLADGGKLFTVDLLVIGAIKRTLSVSTAFRSLVAQRNFLCAAALLRMNLDTAARLFALWLVNDPEAHAKAIISGIPLRQLKAADGQRLYDKHIVDRLAELEPWARSVWEKTSEFIHFSDRHAFAAVTGLDDATHRLEMFVSAKDEHLEDSRWHELLDAFVASTRLVGTFVESWRQHKSGERQ